MAYLCEVVRRSVVQTVVDCYALLVLHTLTERQPMQFISDERRNGIKFPTTGDEASRSTDDGLEMARNSVTCPNEHAIAIVKTVQHASNY